MVKYVIVTLFFLNISFAQHFDFRLSNRIDLENYSIADFDGDSLSLWNYNNRRHINVAVNSIIKITERQRKGFSIFAKSVPITAGVLGAIGFLVDNNTRTEKDMYSYDNSQSFAAAGAILGAGFGLYKTFFGDTEFSLSDLDEFDKNELIQRLIDVYYTTYLVTDTLKLSNCANNLDNDIQSDSFERMLYTFKKNRWKVYIKREDKFEIFAKLRSDNPYQTELIASINSSGDVNINRIKKTYIPKNNLRYLKSHLKRLEITFQSVRCVEPEGLIKN